MTAYNRDDGAVFEITLPQLLEEPIAGQEGDIVAATVADAPVVEMVH